MGITRNGMANRSFRGSGEPEIRPSRNEIRTEKPIGRMPPAAAARDQAKLATKFLAHDTRNWFTVLQVYCDLLQTPGATAGSYRTWTQELSAAIHRGQHLVLSLLDSLQDSAPGDSAAQAPEPASADRRDRREAAVPEAAADMHADMRAEIHAEIHAKTHAESRGGPASSSGLDLARAIERRLPVLQRMAGDAIPVEIDLPAEPVPVPIADDRLERILVNLVQNAIEAMPNGGLLRIVCQLTDGNAEQATEGTDPGNGPKARPQRAALLQVCDTGSGIAPELLPHIFTSGVSSKSSANLQDFPNGPAAAREPGSLHAAGWNEHGLGLAIVRELTESAGGSVRVTSRRNFGACFELTFPVLDLEAALDGATGARTAASGAREPDGKEQGPI